MPRFVLGMCYIKTCVGVQWTTMLAVSLDNSLETEGVVFNFLICVHISLKRNLYLPLWVEFIVNPIMVIVYTNSRNVLRQ